MDNLFTTVTSSITRLNCTGAYFVGQHGLYQVAKVQFKNGRLGERKLIVTGTPVLGSTELSTNCESLARTRSIGVILA